MSPTIRLLTADDAAVLSRVDPDVFDNPIDPILTAEFLTDPRHHIVVAIDDDVVVGMATAVHYVHPDKPRELWINEVGVASTHQNQGIAKAMMRCPTRAWSEHRMHRGVARDGTGERGREENVCGGRREGGADGVRDLRAR